MWDDTVAPEVILDFDAPHMPGKTVLLSFAVAFSFLFGVLGLNYLNEPEKKRPVVSRALVMPFDGLRAEMGLEPSADYVEEEVEVAHGHGHGHH